MLQSLQLLIAAVFPALVIVAALKDITSFTIPNWISLALTALFIPAALAAGLSLSEFGIHLAVGAAALVIGVAMFAPGWIGGGDAKLLAAACLWLGLQPLAMFLLVTALAGGALALILLRLRGNLFRGVLPVGPAWVERLRQPKGPAPYGVAIAIGALAAFPQSALVIVAGG